MISKKELARDVRRKRASCMITQEELGKMAGISTPTISKIERGCNSVKIENYIDALQTLNKVEDSNGAV